jgi:hypothetical protein
LIALAAYVPSVQLLSRLGYTIYMSQAFHLQNLLLYPLVALGAASLVALFVERRLGAVFTVISVLLGVAIYFSPALE